MKSIVLRSRDLIDPESEIHYAFHKSLHEITVMHSHDFYEIFLVISGKALHRINGKEKILKPGDLVFIRPEDSHNYEKMENENCELINIAFPATVIDKLFEYLGEGYKPERLLNSKYPSRINLPEVEKEILRKRFEALNTISRNDKERIRTELRILLAEIFSRYFISGRDDNKENIPAWLANLTLEMQKKENFIQGFKRMQDLAGRSPEHLSRSFRMYLGETPTDYLNSIKLNYAANLISNSDEEITTIAVEAGFENLSHFYHTFKKHFKVTPKNFRKKHQKSIIPF